MVLTETPDYNDRMLKYNCNFSGQGRPHGGGGGGGGNWGIFPPAPARKGPLEYLFKERSIYSNRAVRI